MDGVVRAVGPIAAVAVVFVVSACADDGPRRRPRPATTTEPTTSEPAPTGCAAIDQDGDGSTSCDDCDDHDASVYPGAPDAWYDGVDSDCAGNSDYDQDGDGEDVGWVNRRDFDCDDTDPLMYSDDLDHDGFSPCDGDCLDTAPLIHPGAYRVCGDGIDNDCDGLNDCEIAGQHYLPDPRHLMIQERPGESVSLGGIRVADTDGDGELELLVGTSYWIGQVFVFEPDVPNGSTPDAASASGWMRSRSRPATGRASRCIGWAGKRSSACATSAGTPASM